MAGPSAWPYYMPQSQGGMIDHVARSSEQHGRDIEAIWQRLGPETKDLPPFPSSEGGGGSAIIGTLTSTLSRAGSATLSTGDTVYDNTMLPGTIALPVGTFIVAVEDAASGNFYIIPPPWCFRLRGTLPSGAITNNSTGSVVLSNSMGTVTARNRKGESSPTGSKGCECQWEEVPGGTSEWLISDWNCA